MSPTWGFISIKGRFRDDDYTQLTRLSFVFKAGHRFQADLPLWQFHTVTRLCDHRVIWIGHQYPYQAAMVLGGVMLTIAALLKLLLRFTENAAFASDDLARIA